MNHYIKPKKARLVRVFLCPFTLGTDQEDINKKAAGACTPAAHHCSPHHHNSIYFVLEAGPLQLIRCEGYSHHECKLAMRLGGCRHV